MLRSTTDIVNDTWYAVAITRNGNTFRLFVNGDLEATETFAGSLDGNLNRTLTVGRAQSAATPWNGYIDEIRISNIARYTANYTPSTTALTNDANTLLLLHCDGTNGSTSFPDDNIGLVPGGIIIGY
jgi:hypothetical protein